MLPLPEISSLCSIHAVAWLTWHHMGYTAVKGSHHDLLGAYLAAWLSDLAVHASPGTNYHDCLLEQR